jgi:hypothetical protein
VCCESLRNAHTGPPPGIYGTGFYGAIDAGANVYQDRGGTRTFTEDFDDFTATLTIAPKNEVGFFGGIKLGYVFGTGVFRPTIRRGLLLQRVRGRRLTATWQSMGL